MKTIQTLTGGCLLLGSPHFEDDRGSFIKFFNHDSPLENYQIAQVNFVQNKQIGILRGLHYQQGSHTESKFFRATQGKINLVFLDLRPDSSTYQQADSVILDKSDVGLWIPTGFATGYEVLAINTDILYFSNQAYIPESENGINWQDPMVHEHWHTPNPIVSDKDQNWPLWKP
ncbi:dTDP-4-dehydrorhamnose 3,5-epimerase family protein [Reichenbachiella sp. MSK19-1]|uniref:dTDP-4-dehydrorhamnose 3,5-epimerase family protein n=1 Tax=Reichenbachiella sp. MSK19-1 TaxID=1897631 RepID=UPI000E6D3842|nr:dTDP-4-dehydrorhamnose 3,5-epimerase family protein [Reichenbachiella sp. MSK19-1]RJE70866.1 hypothetical protein BGP76_08770 [Reichenbachiella sp. MSK19-1]